MLTSRATRSDAISYEKGAAVLKMLSDIIGQDNLIKGT